MNEKQGKIDILGPNTFLHFCDCVVCKSLRDDLGRSCHSCGTHHVYRVGADAELTRLRAEVDNCNAIKENIIRMDREIQRLSAILSRVEDVEGMAKVIENEGGYRMTETAQESRMRWCRAVRDYIKGEGVMDLTYSADYVRQLCDEIDDLRASLAAATARAEKAEAEVERLREAVQWAMDRFRNAGDDPGDVTMRNVLSRRTGKGE